MYETIKMRWSGVYPLMLHNGDLANPKNKFAKAMKVVSKKRNKTDDDFDLLSAIEWAGGLYTDGDIDLAIDGYDVTFTGGGNVYIPGEIIESTLIEGAKKQRLGKDFRAGVLVDGNPLLQFPLMGKSVQELWQSEKHLDIRKVRIQKNSVMRSRPIFPEWVIEFEVKFLPDVIQNAETLVEIATNAGKIIGLCEYRPRYGRFNVEVIG
jgi:hypothetical protein